jgi:hypothetical protein
VKAFKRALGKTSFDVLMTGLARYKADKPVARPWLNPATWLNQERWNDVPSNGHDVSVNDAVSDSEKQNILDRMVKSLNGGKASEPEL